MPELPEVETTRRGLAPAMEGARIARLELRRDDLRFPFPAGLAEKVAGQRILSLGRRAKYLLVDLENGASLVCHLGMSGSFRIENSTADTAPGAFHHPRGKDSKHDHVIFHLESGEAVSRVIYNDPRRFGFVDYIEAGQHDLYPSFRNLGPEPTGNILDATWLAGRFDGKKKPLKTALLDQSIIAGLGNIYVCEALWRAHLSPLRAISTMVEADGTPGPALEILVSKIRDVIADAIEAGGSSLRDHIRTDGTLGYFQHSFSVYDREGQACRTPGCNGTVERMTQAGRSSFHCPVCQH